MEQDEIFECYEGDRWFERNSGLLTPHDDYVIFLLELYGILSPDVKVLEVGAANGYRLARIYEKYGCEVHAVEPSKKAVEDGKTRFPYMHFYPRALKDIDFDEMFDIVIVQSVFHWIDRKNLLLSASNIDRSLRAGGKLVIGDFQTPFPVKRRYHHIEDREVYTYKLRYKDIFLSTGSYIELSAIAINHDEKSFKNITLGNVFVLSLLSKEGIYTDL
ncbi:MAG: class I SAM-dependent methyltransferase [Nitrospirota bacterium]